MGKILMFLMLSFLIVGTSCQNDEPRLKIEKDKVKELEITDPVKVNQFEIGRVINSYLKEKGKSLSRANEVSISNLNKSGENVAYVINFLPNNGFLIVSATKNNFPILAYADEGLFDTEQSDGGLEDWKDDLFSSVNYLNSNPECLYAIKAKKKWEKFEKGNRLTINSRGGIGGDDDHMSMPTDEDMKILTKICYDSINYWGTRPDMNVYTLQEYIARYPDREDLEERAKQLIYTEYQGAYKDFTFIVERTHQIYENSDILVDSKWYQGEIDTTIVSYNQCFGVFPLGSRKLAGCGPIAAAQIMYAYKWPQSYNWSQMKPDEPTLESAKLIFDITESSNPKYEWLFGTSVNFKDLLNTLHKFGYSASRCSNTDGKFPYTVPCIVGSIMYDEDGQTSEYNNHAWVIGGQKYTSWRTVTELWTFLDFYYFSFIDIGPESDGSLTYLYANWGYKNGVDNGWYLSIDSMVPRSEFSSKKDIELIYSIRPNK